MKKTVLITGRLHPKAIEGLNRQQDFDLHYYPDSPLSKIEHILKKTHILITRSETNITRQTLDKAPILNTVIRAAVGVANIDIDYATKRGILVVNIPGKNTNSAAEHTIALMFSMLRNIPQAHSSLKSGKWDRHIFCGQELRHQTLGLVGLGNVGHRVAKFAQSFEMKVLAYDPYISPTRFIKYKVTPCNSLEELAAQSNILSLHLPLNKETQSIINEKILSKMKAKSFLINVARGGVICEQSVLNALDTGQLKGVSIDTWINEPTPNKKLTQHPNVWCSPHIGGYTYEAQETVGLSVVEQINKITKNGITDFPVNLPQMTSLDNNLIWQYALLAEKLGAFAVQVIDFNPEKITIIYRGSLKDNSQELIRLGFFKGYSQSIMSKYISYVNAKECFSSLGIKVTEEESDCEHIYKSSLEIKIENSDGQSFQTEGTVLETNMLRLSSINKFTFEVPAAGNFLVIENKDEPGVIGDVGSVLGKNNINIESFSLSRHTKKGLAMSLLKIDSEISDNILELIKKIKHIKKIRRALI